MAPVKTRSTSSRHRPHRGYKADPEDTNDDEDFYGMRELKHQLASLNLQLKDTMGDGNCLFRACADQFYGIEKDHTSLRAEVCQYIEEHTEHFKSFLDNETVEAHVAQMRKNGTYGGNIELVAFARMKRVDIKVYQPGYIFVIEGVDVKKEGSSPGQRPTMHIAYHSWEHYSSIRNIDGPHEGLPEINPRPTKQQPLAKLTNKDPPRAIEREIMKISGVNDLELIRELLEKYRGDFDCVYNDLAEKVFADANGSDRDDNSSPEGETKEESKGSVQKTKGEQDTKAGKTKDPKAGTKDEIITAPDPPSQSNSIDTEPSVACSKSSSRASSPGFVPSRTGSPAISSTETPMASDEPAQGVIPKKRISAREKKELAKRNQKLNRKNKGKVGAASADASPSSNSSSGGERNSTDHPASRAGSNMRELFV
ncbi:hypothetical protein BC939DRAFT_449336 [Gamsiella multidivaricata]|uniref:uncharacterized protein n=1 Tax=Gamsiella multidivaricata TaxID=101098 RepID=UPI00221E6857|nr:uncharacterized protein BC939DRAFT_449336 [Gamsiella multidivaricata]KAG0368415.1 hypothetical protein BGZ54_001989 [Gamsiella multidivaricata]KAI7824831.1 hypothetical protein BC939DRAFT_449336 [Gamsiella multidivaricata]